MKFQVKVVEEAVRRAKEEIVADQDEVGQLYRQFSLAEKGRDQSNSISSAGGISEDGLRAMQQRVKKVFEAMKTLLDTFKSDAAARASEMEE